MARRLLIILIMALLILPSASAYIYTEEEDGNLKVPVGGNIFIMAKLENTTKLNQEGISDGNFTSLNHTFPYKAAYKITYRTADGKTDYLITWKCNVSNYFDDYVFSNYDFYSGYLTDNKTPIYMEYDNGYVHGIVMDTENVTCTEADLVHKILGRYNYVLSDTTYPEATYSGDYRQHYDGPVIDPYETVENDPYAYYDYFDYEDNLQIDDYLYDYGYDE